MNVSASNSLSFLQIVTVVTTRPIPSYGTVAKADAYFDGMLEGQRWMDSPNDRKIKALASATMRIDRLNFVGSKATSDQLLQFPRGTDTLVPVDIEHACYELAQAMLKGVDPDTETDLANTTFQGYGGLRTEFDRSLNHAYIVAGIPCKAAWDLLLPYLNGRRETKLNRV